MTKRRNSRNISYVVSPAGIEEIFKRGYRYFKRTIDDVILYKAGIEQLIAEAIAAGYKTVALVGKSDLEFIVEYTCEKNGITFEKVNQEKVTDEMFVLYGEQYDLEDIADEKHWLRSIIMRKK